LTDCDRHGIYQFNYSTKYCAISADKMRKAKDLLTRALCQVTKGHATLAGKSDDLRVYLTGEPVDAH